MSNRKEPESVRCFKAHHRRAENVVWWENSSSAIELKSQHNDGERECCGVYTSVWEVLQPELQPERSLRATQTICTSMCYWSALKAPQWELIQTRAHEAKSDQSVNSNLLFNLFLAEQNLSALGRAFCCTEAEEHKAVMTLKHEGILSQMTCFYDPNNTTWHDTKPRILILTHYIFLQI